MAVELNDIYGRESVDINEVHARMNGKRRQADTGTICYNCYEKGHFKNDSKKPKKQNFNDQQSDSQQVKSNALVLNRISQSNAISGNCVIDDNVTSFMADTGAEMTVIDVEVLQPDQRMDIKPTNFDVILADGSKVDVLGMKMCNITVGTDTVQLEVLLTTRLNQTCLLGKDFLRKCPSTRTLVHNLESASNGENLTINSIGTNVEDGNVKQTTFDKDRVVNMEHCILKWIKHKFSNGMYIFNRIVNKSKTKLSPSQSKPQQTKSSHDTGPGHIEKKKAEKCGQPTKVRVFQTNVRPGVSNFESSLESTLVSTLESSLKNYLKRFDSNGMTSNTIKDPIDDVEYRKRLEKNYVNFLWT
jgi:hypothetical protein